MATVSNPASLSSVKTVFGGTGKLSDYVRGGTYVPSNASSTISTTVAGLALSQFNGVSNPVAASANPTSVNGSASGTTLQGQVTSASTTVTATGGSGTYTYSWAYLSGDSTITATASTSRTTAFTATVHDSSPKSATFRCTVNDGTSNVTVDVNVTLTWTSNV